jgi:hypothetical protein
VSEEDILELAWLQRQALEAVKRRIAAQQLGEAFVGLQEATDATTEPDRAPRRAA